MRCLKIILVMFGFGLLSLFFGSVHAEETTHEQTTKNEVWVEDSKEYVVPFTFYLSGEAVLNGRKVVGNVDIVRSGEYVLVTNEGDIIRFKGVEPDTRETNDTNSDGLTLKNGWSGLVFLCFGIIGVALIFHGNK